MVGKNLDLDGVYWVRLQRLKHREATSPARVTATSGLPAISVAVTGIDVYLCSAFAVYQHLVNLVNEFESSD